MELLGLAWLAVAIGCAILAKAKNRDQTGWFLLGIAFSLIALIIIAGMPALANTTGGGRMKIEPPKICPNCKFHNPRVRHTCCNCGEPIDHV